MGGDAVPKDVQGDGLSDVVFSVIALNLRIRLA
jgi:acetylglutamate synthase